MQTPDDREFGSSSPMSLDTFTLAHISCPFCVIFAYVRPEEKWVSTCRYCTNAALMHTKNRFRQSLKHSGAFFSISIRSCDGNG